MSRFLFIFLPSLLLVSGCGYSLNHRLKPTFTQGRGIFVPVFTNSTEETGAEVVFTNALIRELESRGEIVMTHRQSEAMELRGTLTSISYAGTAASPFGFQGLQENRRLPTEIGVTVAMVLELVDPDGKVIWGNSFSGFRRISTPVRRTYDYQAPSSIGLTTQSLIASQYPLIAGDIMRDVYDDIVELF